jgi:uncharacterized membrane protein
MDRCLRGRLRRIDRVSGAAAKSVTKSGTMDSASDSPARLEKTEQELLAELRKLRRDLRCRIADDGMSMEGLTFGQRIADVVAAAMGSWRFIVLQSLILFTWIVFNVVAVAHKWDPYPFILLNLTLSFQAAYAAPFIMMSQNRQQDIDRKAAENDYKINVKAELEIELLHEKIDQLRAKEVLRLTESVRCLTKLLQKESAGADEMNTAQVTPNSSRDGTA